MVLTPGTRLGPYEVTALIGAGGMGEVYRATDTDLKRQVALKVLPAAVANDVDRLARFQREAEVLGALNHPNIAHIFGLEKAKGTIALAMELVEGPTLAERIAKDAIPLDEALPIAKQIAEALETAHQQGVVHRDLKPANIKIRDDGTVKVLDFGLAKAMEPAAAVDPMMTGAPTNAVPGQLTDTGVILGTAAYMSPEQARGKSVDKRADIWAFGCVLFEMLTGQRAFPGETPSDALAAVLEREPQWSRLPEGTPPGVRRLLRRCVMKDLRERIHDIADARLEIDDARAGQSAAGTALEHKRSAGARIGRALALVIAGAAIALATWIVARRDTAPAGSEAPDTKIDQLTNDAGVTRMPALSPDGRLLAYASDRAGNGDLDIWLQQVAGTTPLRLTEDPADDTSPDFSPDGSQVVFRSERSGGGVYVVSTLGGPARLIASEGRQPRFSPDGKQIAYWVGAPRTRSSQLRAVYVVALAGGAPLRVAADLQAATDPVWLPDSRSLLVAGRHDDSSRLSESFDWWVAGLDGSPSVRTGVLQMPLLHGSEIVASRWTRSGVLFTFDGDLWTIAVSNSGRVSGSPHRLTLGVGPHLEPAAGPDDEVVFARIVSARVIERASLTKVSEPPARLYADTGTTTWRASETPDGNLIVFERALAEARELWTKNTQSGRQELIARVATTGQLNETISADGARIAYTQDSDIALGASGGIGFVVERSGGVPRKICDECGLGGFLPDNYQVLASVNDGHAIRVVDSRTGVARDVVTGMTGERLDRPHLSPDGRWLAFRIAKNAGGKSYVVRFTTGAPTSTRGLDAIDEPTTSGRPAGWSVDSRLVYLLLDTDGFRCLWAQPIDTTTGKATGKPVAVRHFHSTRGMSTSVGNPVSPDGFLYEAAEESANLWRLTPSRHSPPQR